MMNKDRRWDKFEIIESDVNGYYAYLPAIFIDSDLSLHKNSAQLERISYKRYIPDTTTEGNPIIKYTIGMSYAYFPFFIVSAVRAKLSNYSVNGYSFPFRTIIHFSGLFYLIIGLIFLFKFLRFLFCERTVLLTIITMVFGTNLFYYVTCEGAMPHVLDCSIFAALLFYSYSFSLKKKLSLLIGILICTSWLTLIRPVNSLSILIPLFFNITNKNDFVERLKFLFQTKKTVILIIIIPLIIFLPQLIYWKISTGHLLFYSYQNEGFDLSNPEIINGLFSYRKGWFIYSPVWILIVPGFILLFLRLKNLFWFIFLFFLLYIYIIFSWWSWCYSGSFGCRAIIDIYPLLSIVLASFIERVISSNFISKIIVGLFIVFTIKLNFFQTNQYVAGIIHWDKMDKITYWKVFGKVALTKEERNFVEKKWDSNYK